MKNKDKVPVSIRVRKDLMDALRELAAREQRTMAHYVDQALEDLIDKHSKSDK